MSQSEPATVARFVVDSLDVLVYETRAQAGRAGHHRDSRLCNPYNDTFAAGIPRGFGFFSSSLKLTTACGPRNRQTFVVA